MSFIPKNLNVALKGMVLILNPGGWLGFMSHPALFFYNVLGMTRFISESRRKKLLINDYFTWKRDHNRRYDMYRAVSDAYGLHQAAVDYLEFGVAGANSIKWWLGENKNTDSRFHGFDTFEGLPEDWDASFKKGAMSFNMPQLDDQRARFYKGLFQDTLGPFLQSNALVAGRKKIIHLDADLFSSTLFALSMLSEHLKPGDIVFFDEFNVPNHEYYALRIFEKTFYREFKLIGAVNNYYQTAFEVVK